MATTTTEDFLGLDGAGLVVGERLHGAFGGMFGGALAAAAVRAARAGAEGHRPASLDIRFLRPLAAGRATVRTTVLHAGRTLATVSVDVADERDRLVARATVGLVAAAALHPTEVDTVRSMPPTEPYASGTDWRSPTGTEIPIVTTLRPRVVGSGPHGVATGLLVPWHDPEAHAEAACLAADMCVGPPVANATAGTWIPHPNPDLSLRFAGPVTGDELVGIGRVERIADGLASVAIEVWSDGALVAVGVSSSMLLRS